MKIKYFVLGAVSVSLVGALTFGAYRMGMRAGNEESEPPPVQAQMSSAVDAPDDPDIILLEQPEEKPAVQQEERNPAPEQADNSTPATSQVAQNSVPEEQAVVKPETSAPAKAEKKAPAESQPSIPQPESAPAVPAPAAAQPAAAPAAETVPQKAAAPLNEGTVFEGHSVTVNDWSTPASYAGGKDWPITVWYFFSEDGRQLGSISGEAAMKISQRYSNGSIEWEYWFAEAFNEFRSVSDDVSDERYEEDVPESGSVISRQPSSSFDVAEAAWEVIQLTNEQREENGLHPLEVDEDLMELAQIRAEEVSRKYSHERPDGTRVVQLGYGENVGAKASAARQVSSWMSSEGHRANILIDWYSSIGVGCYQTDNGKTYWVQVFAP